MLNTALLNLLSGKAEVLGIFQKVVDVFAVRAVLCRLLSCHGSTVAIINDTLVRYHWHLLDSHTIILSGNLVRILLSRLVVLIVTIVHGSALSIGRESLRFLIVIIHVMRRSKTFSRHNLIVSLNLCLSVRQHSCALVSHKSWRIGKLLSCHTTSLMCALCLFGITHGLRNLLGSHSLLDILSVLQLLLCFLNGLCLQCLLLHDVVRLGGIVHLHLLGILQSILCFLNLSVHHLLGILTEVLSKNLRTLLWSHASIVRRRSSLAVRSHRNIGTIGKLTSRLRLLLWYKFLSFGIIFARCGVIFARYGIIFLICGIILWCLLLLLRLCRILHRLLLCRLIIRLRVLHLQSLTILSSKLVDRLILEQSNLICLHVNQFLGIRVQTDKHITAAFLRLASSLVERNITRTH